MGLDRLRALLTEVLPGNRFYRSKLVLTGTVPEFVSWEDYYSRMPFTTKQELVEDQTAFPPYGSNLTFDLVNYTRYSQTSATSGRPMVWLDTADSWNWMLGNWQHVYAAAGVDRRDRIFFAFSFGPFLGFWTAFEAAAQLDALCIPGGGMSSAARLRAMLIHKVSILCCTPTYALRLGEVAREEGIDLKDSRLRRIIVAGEPGGSVGSVRDTVAAAWPKARMFDHYGMTEIGPVAYEAPETAGCLRIIENSYHAEIINPESGDRVGDGEIGELVLTTLGRGACPLLRYRTGDLVRGVRDTASGERLLEGGILGRADDMVLVRGVNIYPRAVDEVVRSIPEITEYQVKVGRKSAMTEVSIAIETSHHNTAAMTAQRLEGALRSVFSLRIPVMVAESGSLPRFEMKARRWIRE
jgi:phenylacetate-CoA ligase